MTVDSFRDAHNNRQQLRAQTSFVDTGVGARFDRARSQDSGVMLAHNQNLGGRNPCTKKTRYIQSI
jgi:hypothetical protein